MEFTGVFNRMWHFFFSHRYVMHCQSRRRMVCVEGGHIYISQSGGGGGMDNCTKYVLSTAYNCSCMWQCIKCSGLRSISKASKENLQLAGTPCRTHYIIVVQLYWGGRGSESNKSETTLFLCRSFFGRTISCDVFQLQDDVIAGKSCSYLRL